MGKVRPNMSGKNHQGSYHWIVLPPEMRGKIGPIDFSQSVTPPRKKQRG